MTFALTTTRLALFVSMSATLVARPAQAEQPEPVGKEAADFVQYFERSCEVDRGAARGKLAPVGFGAARTPGEFARAARYYRRAEPSSEEDCLACKLFLVLKDDDLGLAFSSAHSSYARACEQGDGAACARAGLMLEAGLGVARDVPAAAAYYRRAMAAAGHSAPCAGTEGYLRAAIYAAACERGVGSGCELLAVIRPEEPPVVVSAVVEP